MIKLIITLVIIIICIALLFRFRATEHLIPKIELSLAPKSELPIITVFKSGGFVGMVYELRIYADRTYELLDHGKLKQVGKLNGNENGSVDFLISIFPTLRDAYCDVKGYDFITYRLKVGDRYVNLGTMNTDSQPCISQEIEKYFNQLSELMM